MACPGCARTMTPAALACTSCGLRVEGTFRGNEFALLDADDLQLLRIFVYCEGSIRGMEAALGVSYPTVKARIAALRKRLGLDADPLHAAAATTAPDAVATPDPASATAAARSGADPTDADAVLDALERGDIDAATAIARLRASRQ